MQVKPFLEMKSHSRRVMKKKYKFLPPASKVSIEEWSLDFDFVRSKVQRAERKKSVKKKRLLG